MQYLDAISKMPEWTQFSSKANNLGDLGSIPGLGRAPGEGKGYPLQYSGLENSMDCVVYGVAKSQIWLSDFHSLTHSLTPSICPNQLCWRSWSWTVLWRPTRPSRTNMKTRCPFHHRGLECKSRKSRDTWTNRQIWPWSTKWSRAKANRVLPWERTGHRKHPLPTRQEKTLNMGITRWSIVKSDWLYSLQPKMEKLYTVSKNKTISWLWLRSWPPYCQNQTYVEESRKTTRPFRYDLNQTPSDYTVKVTNRFKGLELIDRVPEELWMEVPDVV